jgi:signal transduction histidine kinase
MKADLVKLRQSLVNLLSNAAKFTDSGTITLSVARSSERLTFRVNDTGIGMDAEQIARLFEPFSQGDAATARKYGGTGLGLAITKRFTEMMGGGIEVESEPGRGTAFTISLPVEVATKKA